MSLRFDPRVRRSRLLMRATLSPAGLVSGGLLAALGIGAGLVSWPWAVAAGLAAWGTSVVLHLRDPRLMSSLLAPQFDRDLGALEGEHRQAMIAGLEARDRFEEAVRALPEDDGFGGMRVRLNDALERLYDSLLWAQRAAQFLRSVRPDRLGHRLSQLPSESPIADELRAQLAEIQDVDARRRETLARATATITGIDTLAVKVGSLALDATAPGAHSHTEEIRQLRGELDTYLAGMEEIEDVLRTLPPQQST